VDRVVPGPRRRRSIAGSTFVVGDIAPALELPTLTGDAFDLADLRGRAVLVSFLRHAG
jgi:peroxiredoxin